jgi:predicted ATPase
MITSITLENFKCFRKVEVHPRRITALVGPNGTGKSSVLQALELLKQSVNDTYQSDRLGHFSLRLQGRLLNLRGYEQLRPSFNDGDQILKIRFAGVNGLSSSKVNEATENIQFEFEVESLDGESNLFNVKKHEPRGTPEQVLKAMKVAPAIRGLVQPVYSVGSQKTEDISLYSQDSETATYLHYTRRLENKISDLIRRVTGVGLMAEPVPPQSVEIASLAPGGEVVNIVAEGFGTNALVLLFMQLASAIRGATVLIEEPEIHLHPKAQAELASVLVEEVQAEDKQIIMTTHSEHILNHLLTLVAERKLTPDDVAIYAFEKDEKGECTANRIQVFEDGRVEGGIKDFFETDLDELNRFVEAMKSRIESKG